MFIDLHLCTPEEQLVPRSNCLREIAIFCPSKQYRLTTKDRCLVPSKLNYLIIDTSAIFTSGLSICPSAWMLSKDLPAGSLSCHFIALDGLELSFGFSCTSTGSLTLLPAQESFSFG